MLSVAEKTKILLKRQGMTIAQLADKLNISRQNLSNKLTRNNFDEKDIKTIAEAINCDVDIVFTDKTTGEII
ncbi:helix-turn-helix transcriptional regulator [Lachnospiraceae bacterium MD329]|nr:helix-turn-helix transcriptional regulator [Lachnospiraceae bacterium MD329]